MIAHNSGNQPATGAGYQRWVGDSECHRPVAVIGGLVSSRPTATLPVVTRWGDDAACVRPVQRPGVSCREEVDVVPIPNVSARSRPGDGETSYGRVVANSCHGTAGVFERPVGLVRVRRCCEVGAHGAATVPTAGTDGDCACGRIDRRHRGHPA